MDKSFTKNLPSVSFGSLWDKDGTHYNQSVRIVLNKHDLQRLSDKLRLLAADWIHSDDTFLKSNSVHLLKELDFGMNFLSLSQLNAICNIMDWNRCKRIHLDRNTCLTIIQC